MFRWNSDTPTDVIATVQAGLDGLAQLDAVHEYRHGPDAGLAEGNFDYVVVGDFLSVEDYRAYATDEGHVALIKEHIAPNISERVAVQYEF